MLSSTKILSQVQKEKEKFYLGFCLKLNCRSNYHSDIDYQIETGAIQLIHRYQNSVITWQGINPPPKNIVFLGSMISFSQEFALYISTPNKF